MKITILNDASLDLREGFQFYENIDKGLGGYFLDSLYSDIDSLVVYKGVHPVYFGIYYRMLSKRFPFAVYYRIIGEDVLIYAVLDCRRSPAWVRGRINSGLS
jgi:hypothetical protein